MRNFRVYADLSGPGTANVLEQVLEQRERLADRLGQVRNVVAIGSGKGGVGKSAITANLSAILAHRGCRTGAVDGDLNGPSLPRMLSASTEPLRVSEAGVHPAVGVAGVRLISIELLLQTESTPLRWRGPTSDASLWRGALETGAMRELLSDVVWGELDYLLVDLPPGTDRIERFLELVPQPAALILVTTPSAAAAHVVSKSLRLAAESGIERFGLVNNMSRFICPCCGNEAPLFADEHPALRPDTEVPVWAEIPFDARLAIETDSGSPLALSSPSSPAAQALLSLADRLQETCP